jgi:predicted phage terminase large subunit-like protein
LNRTKLEKMNKLRSLLMPEIPDEASGFQTDLQALRELMLKHLDCAAFPARADERRELMRQLQTGAPLTGEHGLRKKLGAFDLGFFGRAYLPHYFSRPSPAFHRELDDLWQDGVLKGLNPLDNPRMINARAGSHTATAAPRGHAKSTNLTFKDTLHSVAYAYKHYAIILSDTRDQAAGFLEAIKEELEENEALREDFGDLRGDIWREDVIVTKTKIKVQAKSAGQKVRGLKHKNWRPDLIVLDDIENDENVRTPEQRQKLLNWFDKAVSKCGDDYTDFVYIGTVLHYDSLLVRVMKRAAYRSVKYQAVISFSGSPLWDEWEYILTTLDNPDRAEDALAFFNAHEAEMLAGTKVLWPEKLSYYQLMFMRVDEGEAAFNSEEQNEPINPEDCLFNEEWFDEYNPHDIDFSGKDYEFYGFVDPSLGKSKKSDYSAIQTIALHKPTGYMYDVDSDIERRHPDAIINDVLEKAVWLKKAFNKRYVKFGCEVNQVQWFLKEQMAKASAKRRIYLPLAEVTQTSDKTLRIQTLQPDIKNKYIKFSPKSKRLREQLKYFPMADHDDGPDALEGCRTLAAGGNKQRLRLGRRRFGL